MSSSLISLIPRTVEISKELLTTFNKAKDMLEDRGYEEIKRLSPKEQDGYLVLQSIMRVSQELKTSGNFTFGDILIKLYHPLNGQQSQQNRRDKLNPKIEFYYPNNAKLVKLDAKTLMSIPLWEY